MCINSIHLLNSRCSEIFKVILHPRYFTMIRIIYFKISITADNTSDVFWVHHSRELLKFKWTVSAFETWLTTVVSVDYIVLRVIKSIHSLESHSKSLNNNRGIGSDAFETMFGDKSSLVCSQINIVHSISFAYHCLPGICRQMISCKAFVVVMCSKDSPTKTSINALQ